MLLQKFRFKTVGIVLVALCIVLSAAHVRGDIVQGQYLGTFSGNDSVQALFDELGLDVELLARVEFPDLAEDGLTITPGTLNDDLEPIDGGWSFGGSGLVDILVVKSGPQFAVYLYTDANTNNQRNIGIWDTGDVGGKGMGHISAYTFRAIPEPAGAAFVAVVAAAGMIRRRSR